MENFLRYGKRHLDTYIGVELKLLSVDELRILSIELLAVLKFDAKALETNIAIYYHYI